MGSFFWISKCLALIQLASRLDCSSVSPTRQVGVSILKRIVVDSHCPAKWHNVFSMGDIRQPIGPFYRVG